MELVVDGDNNRVVGRDMYQIQQMQGRLLTKDERKELNDRVQGISDQYGDQPWDIWKSIHRAIGIEGIDQLHIEHRDQVRFMLDLLEERARLKMGFVQPEPKRPAPTISPATSKKSLPAARFMDWVADYPRYCFIVALIGLLIGVMF